jgi:hypothetical protein
MYLALSFFRLASIVQGVVARFHQVILAPNAARLRMRPTIFCGCSQGNSARITDPQGKRLSRFLVFNVVTKSSSGGSNVSSS